MKPCICMYIHVPKVHLITRYVRMNMRFKFLVQYMSSITFGFFVEEDTVNFSTILNRDMRKCEYVWMLFGTMFIHVYALILSLYVRVYTYFIFRSSC